MIGRYGILGIETFSFSVFVLMGGKKVDTLKVETLNA